MSATLLAWLVCYLGLAIRAVARPVYASACYIVSAMVSPPFWWWGAPISAVRWNYLSGLFLLVRVIAGGHHNYTSNPICRRQLTLAVLIVSNATFIHYFIAPNQEISLNGYTYLLKNVLLMCMITASIGAFKDIHEFTWIVLLCLAYVGYEATINERGSFSGGRLEGLGMPNASTANGLASMIVSVLPLFAAIVVSGHRREKIAAILLAPCCVNLLVLCNSRGAFLATIASGFAYLVASPGRERRKAIGVLALGLVCGAMLLGDERIIDRFMTTFAAEEDRDRSAQSRTEYWAAGLKVIASRPLGSGGDSFNKVYGPGLLNQMYGTDYEERSVHQGFINIACDWGVQGLALQLMLFVSGFWLLFKKGRLAYLRGDMHATHFCSAVSACGVAYLITCLFGDFLDDEWGFWVVGMMFGLLRVVDDPLVNARQAAAGA